MSHQPLEHLDISYNQNGIRGEVFAQYICGVHGGNNGCRERCVMLKDLWFIYCNFTVIFQY